MMIKRGNGEEREGYKFNGCIIIVTAKPNREDQFAIKKMYEDYPGIQINIVHQRMKVYKVSQIQNKTMIRPSNAGIGWPNDRLH